ncbi:MAG: type II toxin-antitoxin system VapC family toxin [Candidatus Aenigmarchaeota archaeon]|nr:type II toxin-antitoxin system VapC family toxin [Candidatus Aenigmarchaeota archaeon]
MENVESRVIVDSNILINFLRGKKEDVELIRALSVEKILGTTDINAFELYYGAYKSSKQNEELAGAKGLLNSLFLVSTTEDSMEMAGKIVATLEKKGKSIEMRDLFIGAICLTNSFPLLTKNKKHFENIEGLVLV